MTEAFHNTRVLGKNPELNFRNKINGLKNVTEDLLLGSKVCEKKQLLRCLEKTTKNINTINVIMKQRNNFVPNEASNICGLNSSSRINKDVMKPRIIQIVPLSTNDHNSKKDIHQDSQGVLDKCVSSQANPRSTCPDKNKKISITEDKGINSLLSDRILTKTWMKNHPEDINCPKKLRTFSLNNGKIVNSHLVPAALVSLQNDSTEMLKSSSPKFICTGGGRSEHFIAEHEILSADKESTDSNMTCSVDGNQEKHLENKNVIGHQVTNFISAPNADCNTTRKARGVTELKSIRNRLQDFLPFQADYTTRLFLHRPNIDRLQANIVLSSSFDGNFITKHRRFIHKLPLSRKTNVCRPIPEVITLQMKRPMSVARVNHRQAIGMQNLTIKKTHWLNIGFMIAGTIMLGLVCLSCALFTKDKFSALIFITSGIVIVGIASSTLYYIKRRDTESGAIYKSYRRENHRPTSNHFLPPVN